MTSISSTVGSITTVNTAITQTTKNTDTQSTTQSPGTTTTSFYTTTMNTIIPNLTLPDENLLNIKYANTTSHAWNFYASMPWISDNGSSSNFLINSLKTRFSINLPNDFPTIESVNYFKPIGINQPLPSGFSFDTGMFRSDTASIVLPGKGSCLNLFKIADDFSYNVKCMSQPEQCEYGFSAALWVKFQSNILKSRDYLLTTGPDGQQGFKLYYSLGQLYIIVTGRNSYWSANKTMTKYVGVWTIVGFSWRRFNGEIRLLIGDQFELFTLTQTIHNLNLNPATTGYLGCIRDISGYSDPATSANMSVAHVGFWLWPVRQKSILAGSYVYQMIRNILTTTTSTTTVAPAVTYDYTKMIRQLIGVTSDQNPLYTTADEFISVNNTVFTTGQVALDTSERQGFNLNGKSSKIDITQQRSFANNCPQALERCTNGLSMSMWLKLPNSTESGDILEIVNNVQISYANQVTSIIVYNNSIGLFGAFTTQITIGVWQNLGLAIKFTSQKIDIYINGYLDTFARVLNVSTFQRGPSDKDVNNGDFVIGSGQSNSYTGVSISDIVLWRRYLFSFESHRFVGYTQSQFSQLQSATNYWSTDKYINADARSFLQRVAGSIAPIQMSFSLSSVFVPKVASLSMDIDPFAKSNGQCPTLTQKSNDYLLLARSKLPGTSVLDSDINWTGMCLTDPCQENCRYSGLTVSMWLKIQSVSRTSMQFYFSSGDMANYPGAIIGRGISLFTDQTLFGVSLSSCNSYWNIVIDANRYVLNQWMNIGILWREDIGLQLIINGIDYGLINSIPDQTYKPQDLGFRAVLGRFDTDDTTQWTSNSYWQMSNFVFGEMGYFTRYMSPDQYASVIGLVNNIYYSSVTWLRQGQTLINQPIQDLKAAKTQSQSYNYEGNVEWNSEYGAVTVGSGRVPVMIDQNLCPTNLDNCTVGFSIGGWFFIPNDLTSGLLSCYNIIIQGDPTLSGFGIQFCPNNSTYGWVSTSSFYSVMVPLTSVNVNLNQWIFLGIIWQNKVGLTLIINGNSNFNGIASGRSSQLPVDKRVFVGDAAIGLEWKKTLHVFNTVFYNSNLNVVQLQKFLGMQYNQILLLSKATFFWTAYGIYYNLIKNQLLMTGVTYTNNKYDTSNSAICTAGSDQSFITLKSLTEHCLFDPNTCASFVLVINIKFSPLTNPTQPYGFIFTIGNNVTGVKGVSIHQSPDLIEFMVRNSSTTCRSVMSVPVTGNWVQMKLIWSSFKNQIVKVDENTVAAAITATCVQEVNSPGPTTDITLGRHSSAANLAAKVCISEVMLMHIKSNVDPDSLSSGLFSSSCYQSMDLIYPLGGSCTDQYLMPQGATLLSSAVIKDLLTESCLTNPVKCSNGITISFWVKIDQVSGTEVSLVTVGRPTRRGIGVALSSSSSNGMFGISASLHTGTQLWSLTQDTVVPKSVWTNIGVTWNYITGLSVFINGLILKNTTVPIMETVPDSTIPTSIDISKTISGCIDNVVVWFNVIAYCQSPQLTNKLLGGKCKTDTTIPSQIKCSNVANCINISNSLCIDETSDNVIQLANSVTKLTSSSDSATVLGIALRVLQKSNATTNLTMASVSLLLNVATNMIVSGPITAATALTLITPFVRVNAELIQSKYLDDWTILNNQSMYSPLLVMEAADSFYVKVSKQLDTPCKTVSTTEHSLGVSLLQIDIRQSNCNSVTLPNYMDPIWTQNGSTWSNSTDTISISQQSIQLNGPVISIASSIYLPTSVLSTMASSSVNPNSTLILNINSKIITMTTIPVLPRVINQTMVNIQLKMITPNVRTNKIMAWDIIDPDNPNLQYKWFDVFWNNSLPAFNSSFGSWDNLGCNATNWNTTNIAFSCDHMTNFAILMEPVSSPNTSIVTILSYVTMVGSIISILCLLIFIITIAASKHLRGVRYIIHLNMAIAMLVALISLLLVQSAVQSQVFCQAVGILMHLFFLATFSWFFIESLYAFYAVTSGVVDGKLKCYVPFGWFVPIIIVGVTAGLSLDSYGRNQFCWLSQSSVFLWAFVGPMIFLISGSVVVSLVVACNISTPAVKGDVLDEVRNNIKETAIMIPFILLGWLFGFMYLSIPNIALAFLFVILCSLEGFFVLIFFGLMNPDFRYVICRRTRPHEALESETAILDKIEVDGSSRSSLRGNSRSSVMPMPPPKMNAPVYYSSNPKSKPPRHMDSVECSQSSLKSDRRLITESYRENEDTEEIDTNTIQNNGVPISYSRSIPGTPQYQE